MSRWWNRRCFDLFELSWIIALVGVASWSVGRATLLESLTGPTSEGGYLAAIYGPERFSGNEEEWIIRDYFKDRRDGFFVDIGANDYKSSSNTYYLETRLGWSGVAVDPQESFRRNYERFRPRTRFYAFFVSEVSDERATLYVPRWNSLVASSSREFTERRASSVSQVSVPTITLNDLLDRLQVKKIDLLSIDVELAEPKVLAGFDIENAKPALVCIEGHPEVRQDILDYFAKHDYIIVGKYLRADTENLYFRPFN